MAENGLSVSSTISVFLFSLTMLPIVHTSYQNIQFCWHQHCCKLSLLLIKNILVLMPGFWQERSFTCQLSQAGVVEVGSHTWRVGTDHVLVYLGYVWKLPWHLVKKKKRVLLPLTCLQIVPMCPKMYPVLLPQTQLEKYRFFLQKWSWMVVFHLATVSGRRRGRKRSCFNWPGSVTTNMSWDCLDISSKIPSFC